VGAGQVVAVEDLGAVAGDRLGQGGVESTDQRREPPGVVHDEGAAGAGLQPLELLVERRERGGDLAERSQVGGAEGGLGPQTTAPISSTSEEKRISRVYWRSALRSKRRSISAGSRACSNSVRNITEMGACWMNRSKTSPSRMDVVPGRVNYPLA